MNLIVDRRATYYRRSADDRARDPGDWLQRVNAGVAALERLREVSACRRILRDLVAAKRAKNVVPIRLARRPIDRLARL